jgi:hypothetical protein
MPHRYVLSEAPGARRARVAPVWSNPRRRSALLLGAAMVLCIVTAAGAYWVWSAPYRVLDRYITAVERQDTRTVYALADPEERDALQMTPESVAVALAYAFEGPVRRDGTHRDTRWKRREDTPEYTCILFWKDAGTGRRLPGYWGAGRPQLRSSLVVVRSGNGWRVRTGHFIFSTFQSRWSRKDYLARYAEMIERGGVPGHFTDTGDLRMYRDGRMQTVGLRH